jgi:catechol 2,3-dioxygenase-like lactoylglutathione lyase family enzyme
MKPQFSAGRNLAMKVPTHEHERTLAFYRDVLGLRQLAGAAPGSAKTAAFEFGDKVLWIDEVSGISQAELWLEIITDDIELAAQYLHDHNCVRRDGIEPLPEGFHGFWLSSPANIIHLIAAQDQPEIQS